MSQDITAPVKLRVPQVRALQVLAKAHPEGMSVKQIKRRAGMSTLTPADIGPATVGVRPLAASLAGLKMVTVYWEEIDGRDVAFFTATSRGLAAAAKYKLRKRDPVEKVPVDALDRAVLTIRPTRAYGLESYTPADLDAIRKLLPEEHREVLIEDLRGQVLTRRKEGAYAKDVEWPEWYQAYRQSAHFRRVDERDAKRGCAVNGDHEGLLAVYHRSFASVGAEEPEDTVTLCHKCYRRNRKALPRPPKKPLGEISRS